MDPVLGLRFLAYVNEIDVGVTEESGLFSFSFLEQHRVQSKSILRFKAFCQFASCGSCILPRRGELRDDGMAIGFAETALDQYYCHGTNLFQIPSFAEQCQFIALFITNNCGSANPSSAQSAEKVVFNPVVVHGSDEKDWDHDGVMNTAETESNEL